MEVGNHLLHAGDASGHAADQVVLIAIVDSHVWIGWPDQDRVDAAVALFNVVEIAVYGVLPGDRIIKVTILNHHLRLHET